jgi:hypothetical protein
LGLLFAPARGLGRGTRPELEHDVLIIRGKGPLGFHCCQSGRVVIIFSMLAELLT